MTNDTFTFFVTVLLVQTKIKNNKQLEIGILETLIAIVSM